ncbi:hypothetical protein BKG82_27195 [Mycobacteroides chelonae]|uniref:Uncharacterized protein n=1 Tax=Mycobacteroides chelonae TaxID=1774 RepID=A0A1S1LGA8_MYCCH|nr:hypothetical protein BKG82_27195 [Mycobacteroides chelonae]
MFTHIESVNKRDGAPVWRVITGAGIYDVAPKGVVARNIESPEYAGLLVLSVSSSGGRSRIVGMATRDHLHKCGSIDY